MLVLVASCGCHRRVARGFFDGPRDSILFDLKGYVFPASEVYLWNGLKCGGYYFFCFNEQQKRMGWCSFQSFLIAVSCDKHKTAHVPLPGGGGIKNISFVSARNDTLVIGLRGDDRYYGFDPKRWEWISYTSNNELKNSLYEDDDWIVKYLNCGEFGDATWFIDKHTEDEFAFVDMKGSIHRIDNTFYVVNQTSVYRLDDPSIGFRCDSTTTFKNARDTGIIHDLFDDAGYSVPDYKLLPIVHFYNEPAEIDVHYYGNGTNWVGNSYVSDYTKAHTSIIGSFVASDTLFCALSTPAGLELAKLDNGSLITIHSFHRDVGAFPRFDFNEEYPSIASSSMYRDKSNQPEDKLLILVNIEPGSSELFDISRDGNALLTLCYDAGGLNPVEQDGFEELLRFYLKDWDGLILDSVIRKEKSLGGEISYLNLGTDTNNYPPEEIFKKEESYHIDCITKQIDDSYEVNSKYWVQESNQSITAIFMDWSSSRFFDVFYDDDGFDAEAKFRELVEVITEVVGQSGMVIPETDSKIPYTEWHSGQRTIQLYGTDFNVRYLMF